MEAGELEPDDLIAGCLERIRTLNPQFNAFISAVDAAPGAVRAPQVSDDGTSRRRLLLGVPLAVKDLIDVAGLPTTGGSRFFGKEPAPKDAFVIQRLREAGALIIGKTNLHEIALGVTNNNPHFGTCRNPWDTKRIPGGSSGGSAVAVATGMALGALGTDTGGSIRIPAALCGVVGLKPSYGRVSMRGVMPLSWNLDHVGPITRSVRDAALLLQCMDGFDEEDPGCVRRERDDLVGQLGAGIKGLKVGLAVGDYINVANTEVLAAVREAARVLHELGAVVTETEPPGLHDAARANLIMTQADAATVHADRLKTHPDWFGEDVRRRLETGAVCAATEYAATHRTQAVVRRQLEIYFEENDVLILPTTPIAAPLIKGQDAVEQARRLTRYTAPFNLTGLPALSVPCGFTQAGLPVGLQIVGAPWTEALVLRVGHAYEQATDWHARTPPLSL
jgi:aspartyl-tRNA(Asn)/glutamyl-tRNA(Gln) amidotransferase subunit A